MYHRTLTFACCSLVLLFGVVPALAQASNPVPSAAGAPGGEAKLVQPPPARASTPAIRRWLDVQAVQGSTRFRWNENSAGRVTTSAVQWQAQLRGRFLFDEAGRYHVGAFATTGASFAGGWNNTGAGLGAFAHPFALRHLYVSAEPIKGLEFQAGGFAINRGLLGEPIAYDNDSYMVGERVTVRPARGAVTQVAITTGHFGDIREPNVFNRLDSMADINYGQALLGFKVGSRTTASLDLTHEAGRDIIREGLNFRMPASAKVLTLVRFEAYQRMEPDAAEGFNVGADAAIGKLAITAGVMSVDAAYGPYNGDRYETGTRYYATLNYPLSSQFALQLFHTKAFNIDFPIALAHRVDFVLIFNPTAALKRARVF